MVTASPDPSTSQHGSGGSHPSLVLAEELLVGNGCWRGKSHFLHGCSMKEEENMLGRRQIPEGVGKEYDQNQLEACMKLSKPEFRIVL